MDNSIIKGLSYGLTSGVITTLGMMVGLYSSTKLKLVVIGGIVTIAIADAFSDALGIHISEESEGEHTHKEIWIATISTWFTKFLFALSFIIPLLIFDLKKAVILSIFYGMILLGVLSYYIAKQQRSKPLVVIFEHLSIAVFVIAATYYIGKLIAVVFR